MWSLNATGMASVRRDDGNLIVHSGSGRAYKSIDSDMPMGSGRKEEACTPDEIAQTYGWVEALIAKLMVRDRTWRARAGMR